jgi:hypothetical protein
MTAEWIELYHSVNEMLLQLGEEGSIGPRDEIVDRVMDALFEIDGGVHNKRMGQ